MLRFFDIDTIFGTEISFTTPDIKLSNYMAYVVYDTSTGVTTLQDYYTWRTPTLVTSTGGVVNDYSNFVISNDNLYPSTTPIIGDYTALEPMYFSVMSYIEYYILMQVIKRIDLARRRLPSPGVVINSLDGYGNSEGTVSVAGGYFKKFSVEELMGYIEGALIEINIHPPATEFYWSFTSLASEKLTNPYQLQNFMGVPYKFVDLIVQGAVLRALIAWGILEVDLQFSTSDGGLQITYDKVSSVASWMDRLLAEFQKQKEFIKWDCVNSYGVGVGTLPFAATGMWGQAMNMIQQGGTLSMQSMLGFQFRANTPL